MSLPALMPYRGIHERLPIIFPEGTPHRDTCTWEIAAKTVFVMLYVGAVEGADRWLRPDQVTRMTDAQAAQTADAVRNAWALDSLRSSKGETPGRWYAGNTRESIRDDTIRTGLVANGAVVERQGLPTTSPAPRYALQAAFASLFDPALDDEAFRRAAESWQADNLTAGALARITIMRKGAVAGGDHVLVNFPSGETRRMAPGNSSLISKAVIEEFAPLFLEQPGVIFLSESKNQVIARDETLAKAVGLSIQTDKNLPDVVLVDLGPKHPLLVFVEVVATDGPISAARKAALTALAVAAGFPEKHIAFVTAYLDRSAGPFKKTIGTIAWGTFIWFASEPRNLIRLEEGGAQSVRRISDWA